MCICTCMHTCIYAGICMCILTFHFTVLKGILIAPLKDPPKHSLQAPLKQTLKESLQESLKGLLKEPLKGSIEINGIPNVP